MLASAAMQDYLAEAYRIAYYQHDIYISTTALAAALNVSAPAVTRMVQRLKEGGFLEHEPYRGIRLTPEGEREALRSIRKHRLVERFLVDVMGFGWHEVHDYADELGSVVSDALAERMDEMIGHPRRCPHGEPIPTREGSMPRLIDESLNEAPLGQAYAVSRANTHDADKLRYLDMLGLRPGVTIKLLDRAPFHGPLHIEVDGQAHFIGYELANVVRVCSREAYDSI